MAHHVTMYRALSEPVTTVGNCSHGSAFAVRGSLVQVRTCVPWLANGCDFAVGSWAACAATGAVTGGSGW
jgi:hypothetical protein